MDRLKALSVFKTIVDRGGFVRAAEALHMSPAQVSRSMQDLEALLGVQLLQRTTRRISLTGTGQDVLEHAGSLLDRYDELASLGRSSAREPTGPVRVMAPTWYGNHLLAQVMLEFSAQFPKVSIDLRLSDQPPDLVANEADLALCREEDLRPDFVARRLAEVQIGVYASPAYLARKGVPHHPSDLLEHDCLSSMGLQCATNWCFSCLDEEEHYELSVKASMGVNHADMLMKFACRGAGVVLLPAFMAEEAVAQGCLVRLLTQWQPVSLTLYLVYGSHRNRAMAVQRLIDHLVERFATKFEPRGGLHLVHRTRQEDLVEARGALAGRDRV